MAGTALGELTPCSRVIDIDLRYPHPHGCNAVAEMRHDAMQRDMLSQRRVRAIRTAAAFSSGEHRRVVGVPVVCSFGTTPSLFPRSGVSYKLRALHAGIKVTWSLAAEVVPLGKRENGPYGRPMP